MKRKYLNWVTDIFMNMFYRWQGERWCMWWWQRYFELRMYSSRCGGAQVKGYWAQYWNGPTGEWKAWGYGYVCRVVRPVDYDRCCCGGWCCDQRDSYSSGTCDDGECSHHVAVEVAVVVDDDVICHCWPQMRTDSVEVCVSHCRCSLLLDNCLSRRWSWVEGPPKGHSPCSISFNKLLIVRHSIGMSIFQSWKGYFLFYASKH